MLFKVNYVEEASQMAASAAGRNQPTLRVTPAQRFVDTVIAANQLSRSVDNVLMRDATVAIEMETLAQLERHLMALEATVAKHESEVKTAAASCPIPKNMNEAVERAFAMHQKAFQDEVSDLRERVLRFEQRCSTHHERQQRGAVDD